MRPMARDPGRKRKAAERRKKRRQREERRRIATEEELRTLAGRMGRAGRWELHDGRVGIDRKEPRKPHVVLARSGPTGITALVALVDLGCLGVKDFHVAEDMSPGAYDELIVAAMEGELEV